MVSSGPRANLSLEAGAARGLSIGSAPGETHRWTKHVVIHVRFAEDVGSTPTASTILRSAPSWYRAKDGALRSALAEQGG